MTVTLTGKAAERARERAGQLGVAPADYIQHLIAADMERDEALDRLLAEAVDDPDETWDIDAIRREGRALAARVRKG